MTKKSKTRREKRPRPVPASPDPASVPDEAEGKSKVTPRQRKGGFAAIRRHMIQGLVVASLLTFIKATWLEKTRFGEELEGAAINLLQGQLADSVASRGEQAKIAIVDISPLSFAEQERPEGNVEVTDRTQLQHVVDDVIKAEPVAIGIDVYFEPDAYGQLTPEDEAFLDYCKQHMGQNSKPRNIYVGVYGSVARGSDRWLGYKKFADLGSAILVPSEDGSQASTGRMDKQLQVGANTVKSISYQLSQDANTDGRGRRWMGGFLNRSVGMLVLDHAPNGSGEIKDDEFQVDFGSVNSMIESRIPANTVPQHLDDLRGKIVFLGRATPGQTNDVFTVGGFKQPIPGVYIHAAALDTLIRSPLYFLSSSGRILADLLTAILALGLVAGVKLYVREATAEKLEWYFPAAVALAVSVIGCLWVDWTGIYWTDFLLVSLVLLVHPLFEGFLNSVFGEDKTVHA